MPAPNRFPGAAPQGLAPQQAQPHASNAGYANPGGHNGDPLEGLFNGIGKGLETIFLPQRASYVDPYSGPQDRGLGVAQSMPQTNRSTPSANQFSGPAPGAYGGPMPWANAPAFGGAAPAPQGAPTGPAPGQAVQKDIFGAKPPEAIKIPDAGGLPPSAAPNHLTGTVSGAVGPIVTPYGASVDPTSDTGRAIDAWSRPQGDQGGQGPVSVSNTFGDWLGGYGADRNEQINSANLARDAALGLTPSVAEQQLQSGLQQNQRAAFSLANSGRGNQGAGLQNAVNSNALQGQITNQQQGILRAGEMAHARDQWGNQLSGIATNDANVAQVGGTLDMTGQSANQSAGIDWSRVGLQSRQLDDTQRTAGLEGLLGYDQLDSNNYWTPQQINAGIRVGNAGSGNQLRGSVIGAGASLLPMLFSGGGMTGAKKPGL